MKTVGDYRRRQMSPWQSAPRVIVESRKDRRLCSDAGLSAAASLKAELLVSLSHLVWTVHISPSIALTCRFFSISTLVRALVTLISGSSLLTHLLHAFQSPLRLGLRSEPISLH